MVAEISFIMLAFYSPASLLSARCSLTSDFIKFHLSLSSYHISKGSDNSFTEYVEFVQLDIDIMVLIITHVTSKITEVLHNFLIHNILCYIRRPAGLYVYVVERLIFIA